MRSRQRQRPARSATEKSSSRRSSRLCVSAPAKRMVTRSRPCKRPKHVQKGTEMMRLETLKKAGLATFASLGALAMTAGAAFAADAPKDPLNSGDTAWMITSSALVLMMTIPGLGLFYGGMVRKKNVLATLMQSFAITCLVTVLWMIVGRSEE